MATWRESTTQANGIDIHYWRTGGNKPVIVCAHGLTDSGRCWSLLAQQLEHEYDLVMPDARGHGRSSAPEHGYQTSDRAADALALLDALQIEQVYALGHSMGGDSTAMLIAQAPERVRAAILEDPSFRPDFAELPSSVADDWERGAEIERAMTHDQLVAHGRAGNPLWDERVLDAWAEAKLQMNLHVFDWLREPRTPWQAYVRQVAVPTLVLTGEPQLGAIITPEIADTLVALSPSITIQPIAGAGHCVRYAQPEAFAEAVRAFLAAHAD